MQNLKRRQRGVATKASLENNVNERQHQQQQPEENENDASTNDLNATGRVESKSRTSLKCLIIISFSILLPSIIIGAFIYNVNNLQKFDPIMYNDVLTDVPAYKWFYMENFLSKESSRLFRDLALNGEPLSTIVEDKNVESAGEAVEVGHVDCRHPFMTLNLNRTMCHFSNRLDVGMHFVKTGGFNGHIEYYDRMVARIIPFRKRLIQSNDPYSYNSFVNLKRLKEFNSESFINKVKSICADNTIIKVKSSKDKSSIVNELFQLDILLMLPGQELPMHLNVPYFWGADRNDFPQWLLVLMKKSKLFDHLFIPQVQGISWLSLDDEDVLVDDNEKNKQTGYVEMQGDNGNFYFYPYLPKKVDKSKQQPDDYDEDLSSNENLTKYVILRSIKNSAILLDGAQVIHGVDRFKSYDLPPLFASNHNYKIRYDPQTKSWQLHDYEWNLLRNYYKKEVKLMVVWNSHCFASDADRVRFHEDRANLKKLSLDDIVDVFKRDLKQKDRLPSDKIELLQLWTIVIKEYLRYPVNTHQQNSTIFGVNYCLLPNIVPDWINDNFLKPFLADRC